MTTRSLTAILTLLFTLPATPGRLAQGAENPAPAPGAERTVRFNRDIRPILSDKCFHCHGPDSKKREADLRLDQRATAVELKAIEPGKPELSEMIVRILSKDRKEHMPPPKSKLGDLTASEVDTLKRWIAEGAEYEAHWAFVPLKPQPPAPGAPQPPTIDELVRRGLAEHGLKLQPEADRRTLLRRLSFDLTGLPPEPGDIQAFVADTKPGAYERQVDRLLASPRFGERMTVDWLDVARYADSYGYQVDREREVWPWRDWVIDAFNRNLRFDQFITWQLAGDLLKNPSDEQILATAFNRLHQQESEGGSVEEEYRVEYVSDRVQTFATTFLGLTFECARCHDHKFDPIEQKDYYRLFAMFQNIDEAGLYSYFTKSPPTPTLELLDDKARKDRAQLDAKVQEAEKALAAVAKSGEAGFAQWLQKRPPEIVLSGEVGRYEFEALDKKKLKNSVRADQPATVQGENKLVPGQTGNGMEFTGDDPVDLPFGNFSQQEPFSVALWIKTPDLKDRAVVFHRSKAWTDAASRGYELLLEEGKLKWSLIHFWPGNAVSIRAQAPVPLDKWTHVVVTSDGSSRAAGLRLYVNGAPVAVDVIKDALTKEITGGGGDNISLGERFRDRGFKGGVIDDFRVFARELTSPEALAACNPEAATALLNKAELSPGERSALEGYYLATASPEHKAALDRLKSVRAEKVKFATSIHELMVMRELPQPKKAFTLFRGQYDQPRDEVFAGTPAALSPFPADAPKNRLGLAQWLTAPDHPLTARVTVNRFWQSIFGRGLVRTSEDFGSQSERPRYQEVLDTLALEFMQSGWDTKALLKRIVTSEVYRQQSIAEPQVMADDPDNEWLARGPRFRLSAEMIRDNALAAAGLLSEKIGGAPVNPYEMSESFKPAEPSGGDGVYRRSIYTRWQRTGPPPAMIAFDAPRRAVCAAKRERTDSPLQALILLNGPQYMEGARVLGERLHREAKGDVAEMVRLGFLRCLSREPDAREQEIVQALYKEQLEHFNQAPKDAAELLKVGRAKADPALPAPVAAAATILAQTLLNHDCCVVKR